MNKINYQKELDRVIDKITEEGKVPKLLLHVCCAPCSSYCLEYLSKYFDITVYFYNPNISIADEYNYRLSEEKRLVSLMPFEHPVKVIEGEYLPKDYFEYVKGLENEPEGGKRCEKCFRLRLESSARYAKEHGFDYFTTTLTISPLKNAQLLNSILARSTAFRGCTATSKSVKATSVQSSFQKNMTFTVKTTAAVSFQKDSMQRKN